MKFAWLKFREFELCFLTGRQKRNWILQRNLPQNVLYLEEKYVVKFSCLSVCNQLNCKTCFFFESISIITDFSVFIIYGNNDNIHEPELNYKKTICIKVRMKSCRRHCICFKPREQKKKKKERVSHSKE